MNPLVIGLTGGIGTGKSHVLDTMLSLGADGVDADRVAYEVMLPGGPAYAPVLAEFGGDLRTEQGLIDRTRLGQRVFGDPGALARLEAIVHPTVFEVTQARVAASAALVFVIEAIKLLEAGMSLTLCDRVWVTVCSRRKQLARLRASRGMPAEEARRRMANQMSPSEMAKHADRLISTDGTMAETDLGVLAAWVELGAPLPEPVMRRATVEDAEGVAAVLNGIVREGGHSILTHTFTPAQERRFMQALPARSRFIVAQYGRIVAGFQVIEPYASYTDALNHVASLGTYVTQAARCRGLGRALSAATFAVALVAGFSKLVINVRADNGPAQAFYERMGFRPAGRLTGQAFVGGRYVDELLYELFLEGALDGADS